MRLTSQSVQFAVRVIGVGALLGTVAGCPTRDVSKVDPNQQRSQYKDIPVATNRDIDILFLVDNSSSMADKQTSLVNNFPRFINVLQNIQGGLPNVHIGVTSSNVGVGGFNIGGCGGSGDDGRLQNTPRGSCTPPMGNFISDVADPMTAMRVKNYTDSLENTFTCVAKLGDQGCGFEHHLEGVKRALDGHNPANAGFVRDSAFLAVVILADEDDCSAKDTAVFDPSQTKVTDPLGPLASFRCTEFGIQCDGKPITRQAANYNNCEPLDNAKYLFHPQHYIDFLKTVKKDPNSILVATIIGNPTPVAVTVDSKGNPTLAHSCSSAIGSADPGVRLAFFANAFPNRNSQVSICNDDLSDALTQIAMLLARVIGNPCLDGNVPDTDLDMSAPGLQIDCQVSDVIDPGTDHQVESPIGRCQMQDETTISPSNTVHPCWYAYHETAKCTTQPSHLALVVDRGGADAPIGTHVIAQCVTN